MQRVVDACRTCTNPAGGVAKPQKEKLKPVFALVLVWCTWYRSCCALGVPRRPYPSMHPLQPLSTTMVPSFGLMILCYEMGIIVL